MRFSMKAGIIGCLLIYNEPEAIFGNSFWFFMEKFRNNIREIIRSIFRNFLPNL